MSNIEQAGTFTLGRPHRKAPWLWRHATRRARRVRSAQGPRRGDRRAARGRGKRRQPHRHQRLLRPARHQPDHPRGAAPYPDDLVIVTKIGARRGADGAWLPALSPEELTQAVHDNLRNLGLEALDVVNLRIMFDTHGPAEGSIEAPLTVLAELQRQGLIRHIGLSNVTPAQIAEGARIAEIVCVQNQYNLAHRADDALIDDLAPRRHRLRAVLPARRLQPAAVFDAV